MTWPAENLVSAATTSIRVSGVIIAIPSARPFEEGAVRFVYMGTATPSRGSGGRSAGVRKIGAAIIPVGSTSRLSGSPRPRRRQIGCGSANPPQDSGGYPAFARFATRELDFDVGIAPLVASPFNAAKSDIKFLDYSAMGLLSVVAEGPVYRDCIEAGLAVGCEANEERLV